MSNRSLFEFNHDMTGQIVMNPKQFVDDILSFLGSASQENADRLERYGMTYIGTRHHTEVGFVKPPRKSARES